MNNIVPSCMCVVKGGKDAGKVVTTIEFLGDFPIVKYSDASKNIFKLMLHENRVWSVDRELTWGFVEAAFIPEKMLLRIDNYGSIKEGDRSVACYETHTEYKPPNHYNCRSLPIPVAKYDMKHPKKLKKYKY